MNISLEIITPEKIIFKDEVNEVIAPTENGQITILPKHIGLFSKIIPGELIVKKEGKQYIVAITGGFLEVAKNKITVLADYAIRAENIEIAKATEAKERAERLMKEKTSEEDTAMIEGQLRRAILELRVANKHKARASKPVTG